MDFLFYMPVANHYLTEIGKKNENENFVNRNLSPEEKNFHHSCSILAKEAYYGDFDVDNYKIVKDYSVSMDSGFKANVYEKDDVVIIAIAGTHGCSFDDWQANIALSFDILPDQYDDAMKLYLKVANDPKNKNKKIYITGHSLGGSLAQLVASTKKYNGESVKKQPLAITFNAKGQRKFINKKEDVDDDVIIEESYNTINYCHKGDSCTSSTKEEAKEDHPGKIIMFDSKDELGDKLNKLSEKIRKLTQTSYDSSAKSSATSIDLFKNHRINNFTGSCLSFFFAKVVEQ